MTWKTSAAKKVCELYEESAESYAAMMDSEIDLPLYADTLGRLSQRLLNVAGPVVDTACGPGHMLLKYRQSHDADRPLIGIDLSPRMIALARARLDAGVVLITGDMRDLAGVETGSAAALVNFFAIHHLDADGIVAALREWNRVLRPAGQLVIAAWEGAGPIDYGDTSDVVALRYTKSEIADWVSQCGFAVDRCVVEPVDEMPMDAVYLEATKETGI